jgi:endoglucanase
MLCANRVSAVRICLLLLSLMLLCATVVPFAASAGLSRAAAGASGAHVAASARTSKRRASGGKLSPRPTSCVVAAHGRNDRKHRKVLKPCIAKKSKAYITGPSGSGSGLPAPPSPRTAVSGSEDPETVETPAEINEAPSAETPEVPSVEGFEPAGPTAPVSTSGGLSIAVKGNHLIDGSGQIVTLHGVNISGTEWQCLYGNAFYGPHSEASIEAIAAWHVNAIRIPLNEDCWLGINGAPTDITTYHEEIRDYVEQLHAHGMYVILDLHWVAPGDALAQQGSEEAFEMADESHAPAFWTSVASYFKEDHAILFDLFNAPHGISWSCWLNGCIAPRGYQTAGMQQLVDTVRETGATQPVMVGALGATELGHAWLENRPSDPAGQLVAAVHVYNQHSTSHFDANIGTVAAQVPVVAGEIGETDCADEDINSFLPWADTHDVSYLAWAWFVGGCASYPALITNYSGTPTSFGIGYREHLLATFPAP